jgi:hypothetical protein
MGLVNKFLSNLEKPFPYAFDKVLFIYKKDSHTTKITIILNLFIYWKQCRVYENIIYKPNLAVKTCQNS